MKQGIFWGLAFLALASFAHAKNVEYVKICSSFEHGEYFYVPGSTNTCVNALTGMTQTVTGNGTVISSESELALRVTALEAQIQQLYLQLAAQNQKE